MSYICLDCGEIFDEPHTYSENVGEFWGTPAYEDFTECPSCGGGFIEMTSEMEDVYEIAYNAGKKFVEGKASGRIKLIKEYVDYKDMTSEQLMKLIEEAIDAKDFTKVVWKYRNK